ncbi:DUF2637 domain-containing protein [Streptomyces aidingensis]|uniref:DUF2637 domain-containing protein n=1 Tax=Streptomyces aidingensis TaxID=910347 RepID=A0A1I1HW64_9ACTN|nr:DUF2637 domain-containing protein [Streptomyces aidingensis]SFC28174.1 Protein of unknown function [Streptomyces aidingensis]
MATIKLTRAHRLLVGIVLTGAVVIAAIGFAGSYAAVRDLAARKGFGEFAPFFPIGIDAGIVVLLALDLLLTWLRIPFPLLRQTAWLLTGATIAFNGAAAWGDPLGVAMHAIIPVLFIITVEAARHAIGRIADITADKHMEGVRLWRWFLAPVPTFRLWRRMKLWELRSYDEVIALERDRLVYRAQLRAQYGRAWRRRAPVEARLPLRLAHLGVPLDDGRQLAGAPAPVLPRALALPAQQAETEPATAAGGPSPEQRRPAAASARPARTPAPAGEPDRERVPAQAAPETPPAENPPAPAANGTARPARHAALTGPDPAPAPEPGPEPAPEPEPAPAPDPGPEAVWGQEPLPAVAGEPLPEPESPPTPAPEPGPGRRRSRRRDPVYAEPAQPAAPAVTVPVTASRTRNLTPPEPEPEPGTPPDEEEPANIPDGTSPGELFYHAYREHLARTGEFANARQLSKVLYDRYGVTDGDGNLLSEGYLRNYLPDLRQRYRAEAGTAV